MQRLLILSLMLWCIGGPQAFGQEKNDALPSRFQALIKNERLRLVRILGTPEMPPTFGPTSAFSADGKRAIYAEDLSAGTDDKPRLRTRLVLWDVQAKAWPREFDIEGKNVTALALSGDGTKALLAGQIIGGAEKKETRPQAYLTLYDLNAGKEIRTVLTRAEYIHCLALAADETTALVGSVQQIKLWDLKQGKEIGAYHEKESTLVTALAYLPDGKQFLAGYHGREILRWDVKTEKPVGRYVSKVKEFGNVWHLAVSRDGKRFASSDFQPSVSLWETSTGKEINLLRIDKRTVEELVLALAIADDGKTVLSCWGKTEPGADDFQGARLIAWNGETNKTLWSHTVPYRGRVPMLVQGENLIMGGGPNWLDVWNIKDGKHRHSRGGHQGTVNAVAALANGAIVSGGQEGLLMTWRKGLLAEKTRAHTGAITAFALAKDRGQWLSAGADLIICHWPLDAKRQPAWKKRHTGPITSLAFGATGVYAASGSGDRSVKIWHVESADESATLTGHSEGINAVAFSPDDQWLASASDDATIRLWPIKAGKLDADREIIVLEDHKKAVTCLAFSPDGQTLITGSQDQTLKVWDWAKGKTLRTIPAHKNWITSLLVLDANTVVTTSDDLTVGMWEVESGRELAKLDFGAVGDCPRCLARLGTDRVLVGSSSWMIYELQIVPAPKSKRGSGSSK